jgi:hypothetical protein
VGATTEQVTPDRRSPRPAAQALLGHPVSYYLWPSLLWSVGLIALFAPLAVWKLKKS